MTSYESFPEIEVNSTRHFPCQTLLSTNIFLNFGIIFLSKTNALLHLILMSIYVTKNLVYLTIFLNRDSVLKLVYI